MKITLRFLILLFFIGLTKIGLAQKEGYNWNFGTYAGINFNTNPPSAITTSKLIGNYGSASISNSKGRLLFCTNGEKVWDSTYTVTPNGAGLNGSKDATQAALIVPRPDSAGQYYIFTIGHLGDTNGLCYSEYRMSLNSGNGDVVSSKKNLKLRYPIGEKLTAVKHKNGRDYWVLAYPLNSDTIYSYLITPQGISSTIVKSKTGFYLKTTFGGSYDAIGAMKISPDGSKIAVTVFTRDTFAIGDFNTITGKVSNIWKIYSYAAGIGVEFSPKNKFLYVVASKTSDISQYDLSKTTASSFLSSRVAVAKYGWYYMGLQLGPDGKIYTNRGGNDSLDVIHAPDSAGKKCRIQYDYINLKKKYTSAGLPNFVQSFFDPNYLYKRNCLHDTTFVWPKVISGLDSIKWDFGDTASGSNNYSKSKPIAYHIYKKSGVYKVKYYSFLGSIKDTTFISIPILDVKPKIGNDTLYCNSFSKKLTPQKNYLKYIWNTGDSVKTITIKTKGTYILKALDSAECFLADTIILKNPIITAQFTPGDTMMCNTSTTIQFKNKTIFKDDTLKSLLWKISDKTSYTDSVFKKSFPTIDSFKIKLIITSKNGCKDSLTKNVLTYNTPKVDFSINKTPQCLNGNNFVFTNSSSIAKGSISADWNFGDGNGSTTQSPSKTYTISGKLTVKLVETSNFGCIDSLKKSITVYHMPKIVFGINNSKQCLNTNKFSFIDSTSDSLTAISRIWKFGDSTISNSKTPTKTYAKSGTYLVKLVVTTNNGCKDSITKTIVVYPLPVIDFTINDTMQCFNDNYFELHDITSSKLVTYTRLWNFGDGKTSTVSGVFKQYTKSGIYNVKLKITTKDGCKDSLIKNLNVLPQPTAKIFVGRFDECLNNNSFEFIDTSLNASGTNNTEWTFGDGSISSFKKFTKKYTALGSYQVRLVSSINFRCTDTTYKTINIWPDPVSDFTISKNDQCLKNNSFKFINNSSLSSGTLKYKWYFGDKDSSSFNNPVKTYSQADTFQVTLISISDHLCKDTSTTIAITRPQPIADYQINDTSQCLDSNNFIFTNTSKIDYGILSYKWAMDDGSASNLQSPTHVYSKSGKYNATLLATSNYSCVDSVSKLLAVYNRPIVSLTVKKDSIFCKGESAVITAVGANSYLWSNSSQNDWISVNTSGKYFVTGITNDCYSKTVSVNIKVNPLPTKPTIVRIGRDSLKSSYTINNQWLKGGNILIDVTNQYYKVSSDGIYNVKYTDLNGCSSISDTLNYKIFVEINNIDQFAGYSVFPNPTHDKITILFNKPVKTKLVLYDILGKQILESDINYSKETKLSLNNLSKGIYYLRIGSNNIKVFKD